MKQEADFPASCFAVVAPGKRTFYRVIDLSLPGSGKG